MSAPVAHPVAEELSSSSTNLVGENTLWITRASATSPHARTGTMAAHTFTTRAQFLGTLQGDCLKLTKKHVSVKREQPSVSDRELLLHSLALR